MGDFIRFILTEEVDLSLAVIEAGLKVVDPQFSIFPDQAAPNTGDVIYSSEVYGEIEVNRPGDVEFQEDILDLRDELKVFTDEEKAPILQAFEQATGMIAFQLSEAGHENYRRIDPFWDWLFDHYRGLLQIDDEGYYDAHDQILG